MATINRLLMEGVIGPLFEVRKVSVLGNAMSENFADVPIEKLFPWVQSIVSNQQAAQHDSMVRARREERKNGH